MERIVTDLRKISKQAKAKQTSEVCQGRPWRSVGLVLAMMVMVLVGFLFTAKSASAATCNDIADGNWNSASTWDCALVPDSDDDVVIDSHTVTITADSSSNTVTINGGTLNMGSYTLTFYHNWTYNTGTIEKGTSTLKFYNNENNSYTFTPGPVEYYNLEFAGDANGGDLTVNGTAVITNDLIINAITHKDLLSGTLRVYGDIKIINNNFTGDVSTTIIEIAGAGDQHISSVGNSDYGSFPSIVINKPSGTLFLEGIVPIYRDWIWQQGNVEAGTSTLKFVNQQNATYTFTPGPVEYYNLEFANNANNSDLIISGTAIVTNNFIVSSSMYASDLLSGTIKVYGNVEFTGTGFTGKDCTAIIEIAGEGEQLLLSAGSTLPSIIINKPSGTLKLEGVIPLYYDWTWQRGNVEAGTSTLKFVGYGIYHYFTPGNVKYYNIELGNLDYPNVNNVYLKGDLEVINKIYIPSYQYNALYLQTHTITTKDFTQTGGTVNLGSGAMKITGNFTRTGGTFTAGTSVVAFQGKNQTINVTGAPTTFYKLYKLTNSADTLTITAGNTITIASGGVMRFWGKYEDVYSNSAMLSIRSSSPGTQYNITLTGSAELEYTDWQDANFSTAVTAAASNDSGNNTNLTVTKEFISTIRASGGDYTTLSAWEAAVNCDLTASTTKVFSHSGITGAMPDNSAVTGSVSGATATLVHATNSQILLKDISGTFQSGEQVQIDGSNYVTITDNGYGAIATAHPYNDWPGGLDDNTSIDGWTTNSACFPKIYVPISQRHHGKLKNASGEYNGFTMIETVYEATCIYNPSTNYLVVDGVAMDVLHSSRGKGISSTENYCRFKSILLNSPKAWGSTMHGIQLSVNSETQYISNSIVSNAEGTYIRPFQLGYRGNVFAYNCSAVDNKGPKGFHIREDSSYNHVRIKNNFSEGATATDFVRESGVGSITAVNNASSDATADDFGGTGNRINQTFKFADEANDNFHLADTDTGAKGYGADLSIDPDFPIIDDIDGAPRPVWDAWDIGADQTPRKIYRSVGPGNTSPLVTGTSNNMVIASDWAIFSSALPDNVGVGDAIQYDSDDDGTIDSIAFISERITSTYYRVQDYLGFTPTQTTTGDTDWAIYRAYTSLYNAERGNENDGIDDAVENFDDWTTGGSKDADEGGRDLTIDDVQWNIACYGDGVDTSSTWIEGWTTSAQNYLRIYTPYLTSEVGESQRHTGKHNTGFRIRGSSYDFVLYDDYVWLDGLDISTTGNSAPIYVNSTGSKEFKISNNLLHADNAPLIYISNGSNTYKIWNNVFYGSKHGIFSFNSTSASAYIYNNTFYFTGTTYPNDYSAIYGSTNVIAKNNICQGQYGGQNGYYCFTGTFNTASDYNISSDNSAPGAHSIHSATVQFRNPSEYDFHLLPTDTTAKNAGVNLSNDAYLPFTTDIDGETRQGTWDIGADETLNETAKIKGKVKMRGVRFGW